jgi:hypothetical protein
MLAKARALAMADRSSCHQSREPNSHVERHITYKLLTEWSTKAAMIALHSLKFTTHRVGGGTVDEATRDLQSVWYQKEWKERTECSVHLLGRYHCIMLGPKTEETVRPSYSGAHSIPIAMPRRFLVYLYRCIV